jgi:uncharacterized protein YrzB (UPF0473 family)
MADEKNMPAAPEAEEPEEETANLITLYDENDKPSTFEVLDEIDYEGQHYTAVFEQANPEQAAEEEGLMIILHTNHDEEGEYLEIVDDDEQMLALGKIFQKRLAGRYDIQE